EHQQWLASRPPGSETATTQLTARHIADVARQPDATLKLKKLDEQTLRAQTEHARQIREVDVARRNLEQQHAHTNLRLPTAGDAVRGSDAGKTGPLVDRIEKGNKTGETAAHGGSPVKLTLPKVELPSALTANSSLPGADTRSAIRRDPAPPLPTAGRGPLASGGKTTTPRTNLLP